MNVVSMQLLKVKYRNVKRCRVLVILDKPSEAASNQAWGCPHIKDKRTKMSDKKKKKTLPAKSEINESWRRLIPV